MADVNDVNTTAAAASASSDLSGDQTAKSRKGKKLVYEPNQRKRNRINRQYAKSISKKIKEWHTKTKIPVMLMTYRNNSVLYECSEGLEPFAKDPVVKDAFIENVVKCGTRNLSRDKSAKITKPNVHFPLDQT